MTLSVDFHYQFEDVFVFRYTVCVGATFLLSNLNNLKKKRYFFSPHLHGLGAKKHDIHSSSVGAKVFVEQRQLYIAVQKKEKKTSIDNNKILQKFCRTPAGNNQSISLHSLCLKTLMLLLGIAKKIITCQVKSALNWSEQTYHMTANRPAGLVLSVGR